MSEQGERVKTRMQEIGRHVHSRIPEGWGFVVFCFQYGGHGEMHYVASTTRRLDIVQAMREWIAVTEEGYAFHEPDEETEVGYAFKGWWRQQLQRPVHPDGLPPVDELCYDAFVAGMEFESKRGER